MGLFDFWKQQQPEQKAELNLYDPVTNRTVLDFSQNQDIFKAYIPNFLYKPPYGMPRKVNIVQIQAMAKNPYVFSVIKTIYDEISALPWEIRIKKRFSDKEDDYSDKIDEISSFFENPNGNEQSFKHLLRQIITDILEIDSAVLVKIFNTAGEFTQMFARSGGTFLKNPDIYGYMGNRANFVPPVPASFGGVRVDIGGTPTPTQQQLMKQYGALYKERAAYFQYGWTAGSMPVPFGKREIVYFMQNPRGDSIYGRSPVEILNEIILNLIYGADYNLDFYTNNNMPEGVVQLLGANREQIQQWRENWQKQFQYKDNLGVTRRKGYQVPASSQEVKWTQFQLSSKEMQILEQQKWFIKLVWACYTPEHEILTENGWKLFSDLNNEKVARVNPETMEMDFVKPLVKQELNYVGEIYNYKSKTCDLSVTADHKMCYYKKHDMEQSSPKLCIKRAKNLNLSEIYLPQAVQWKGNKIDEIELSVESKKGLTEISKKIKIKGDIFIKFMALYLSDGCLDQNRIQIVVSREDKIKVIREVLEELDVDIYETKQKTSSTILGKQYSVKDITRFRFNNAALAEYLRQFGKAHDKFIPDIIKNAIPEQIKLFIKYSIEHGDGSKGYLGRNDRFNSMSKKFIDDFQELCLRLNIASTINRNKSNDCYDLTIRKTKTDKHNTKFYSRILQNNITTEKYNGKVYDVTVPEHHFIIVRKNGRITISSNCFGINATELGFTEDSNRAEGIVQSRIFKRKSIKPLIDLISYHLNTQIITEFFPTGKTDENGFPTIEMFRKIPVEFAFVEYDPVEEKSRLDIIEQQIRMGVKTPEMAAKELGIDLKELEQSKDEALAKALEAQNVIGNGNPDSENDKMDKTETPKENKNIEDSSEEIKDKETESNVEEKAELETKSDKLLIKKTPKPKNPLKEIDDYIDGIGNSIVNAIDDMQRQSK